MYVTIHDLLMKLILYPDCLSVNREVITDKQNKHFKRHDHDFGTVTT